MNILHITAFHISLSTGGTELYIEGLKSAFKSMFHADNRVAVFSPLAVPAGLADDVEFHYPTSTTSEGLERFREECCEMLMRVQPSFAIFHTADNFESVLAEELEKSQIPYLFILHAASWLCYQRGRLFCCKKHCRKMFSPFLCSICLWNGQGSLVLNVLKVFSGEIGRRLGLCATSRYHAIAQELSRKEYLVRRATHCVVLNRRDYDYFIAQGIAPRKLHLLSTGLTEEVLRVCRNNAKIQRTGVLKILCAGRFHPVKGVDILVAAAHGLPEDCLFQLDLCGAHDFEDPYVQHVVALAENDSRIRFLPMIPHDELLKKYAEYDIQCLPSTVFDNGPLALWEGAYSGCRIVASENIGQKEFVRRYGDVIAPNTVSMWLRYLKEAANCPSNLRTRKTEVFPSYNSMNGIAETMMGWISGNKH